MQFVSNKVSTAKYNCLTFVPKNLIEQFRRLANIYFLIIAVLQCIPQISVSGGVPNILLPLIVVLAISAIKDAIEDSKRRKQDNEENSRRVERFRDSKWETIQWRQIMVGDIIKVKEDEYFPCDLLLLTSSSAQGEWFIETKGIDGETNLKRKISHKDTYDHLTDEKILDEKLLGELDGEITCDAPNPIIFQFNATFNFNNRTIFLTPDQFLLRGASLRNTDHIIGIATYTGHESKIMLNSVNAKAKFSLVETVMNKQIFLLFLFQIVLCIICSVVYISWYVDHKDDTEWYLSLNHQEGGTGLEWLFRFLSWMLMFANFVPISLIVTLEIVKFFQAIFISIDLDLYDEETDIPASVQSSSLNEELGQIHYIFSDKTGTLTCNQMEFRKFSLNGELFGTDQDMQGDDKYPHVNFVDPNFMRKTKSSSAVDFWTHLAICHSIVINTRSENEPYMASSPDELALIFAAKYFGVEFVLRDNEFIHLKVHGEDVKYRILEVIEFTSARAKMSVIVQMNDKSVRVYCKGADSAILSSVESCNHLEVSTGHLDQFACEGLRTLAIAQRDLSMDEFLRWKIEYDEAMKDVNNRETKVSDAAKLIEDKLTLLGFTAIEDKLQNNVPETIAVLKEADIKVWVLTGDKVETAVNIGYSSQLLTNETVSIYIDGETTRIVQGQIKESLDKVLAAEGKYAMILSGEALLRIQNQAETGMLADFLKLTDHWEVVIACRISPKQKAEIVMFIRTYKPTVRTLAIGDGANDVNMIAAAHVGVGISGKEGNQAVRASDYSFAQFKCLKKLLLVHGRECYRRNSNLICYNFYKNSLLVMPLFFYGIFSVYSGQTVYNIWMYQIYNVVFTSFPIIFYAVFDQQYTQQELLENPKHYEIGFQSQLFSYRVFWLWILESISESLLLLCVWMYGVTSSTGDSDDGRIDTMWTGGVLVYACVVTLANLKVLQIHYVHFWFSLGMIALSIISYFICSAIFTEYLWISVVFGNFDGRGSTTKMLLNPNSYLVFITIIVAYYIYNAIVKSVYDIVRLKSGNNQIVKRKMSQEVALAQNFNSDDTCVSPTPRSPKGVSIN